MKRTTKQPAKSAETPRFTTTMQTAETVWEIPLAEMRRAKRNGSQAFRSGRIYRDDLIEWLEANPRGPEIAGDESKEGLECQRLKVQIEGLKLRIEREKGELLPAAIVREEQARFVSIFCEECRLLMDKDKYRVFVDRVKSRVKGPNLPA